MKVAEQRLLHQRRTPRGTPLFCPTRSGLDRAGAAARFLEGKQPTGRFVEAEAIGAMAAFLCGEAGRDITGVALPMDGGWSAA